MNVIFRITHGESKMFFSERLGLGSQKTLQLTELNERTRKRILNCFRWVYFSSVYRNVDGLKLSDSNIIRFIVQLLDEYFGELAQYSTSLLNWMIVREKIESHILYDPWYQVYDLIEFFLQKYPYKRDNLKFIACINKVFEEENVGYRIIENRVVPIFEKSEVHEVINALQRTSEWKGVYDDLMSALGHFSDRKRPDYKDAIANSVRAIEGVAKLITHREGTLGELMPKVQQILGLDENFAKAIGQLWRYANKVARHSDPEAQKTPSFEDAKFILITASVIINYLISKAQKKGIVLELKAD